MSATHIHLTAQDMANLYTTISCVVAIFTLLVYDWLLCFDQEVRFIWNWRSRGVTVSSLVYAVSRYSWLVDFLLIARTIYPMSDLSCRANVWSETVMAILGSIGSSTFSALRAYALSNRSIWLMAVIVLLALPSTTVHIVEQFYQAPVNLPSPLNCTASTSRSPKFFDSLLAFTRGSQFAAELLVVGITWWYTYQSYRIRKGLNLGKTISSFLFYNGSMYFLCLATLYILDVILNMSPFPESVNKGASSFDVFIDPITSILTCRFMLSIRQFDSTIASAAYSGLDPQLREHMASTVLQFGAQPSDSLPALIASFAHPVHVDASLFETDPDGIVDNGFEGKEVDVVVPALEGTSSQGQMPEPSQPATEWADFV